MDYEIMVSVYCLAYNHGKYIRNTLNGFIKQKTSFKFEVVVHDDASNDETATIIREFENKYPGIIKPIYQSKNQYSQHVPIINTFIAEKMRGKYIAICEGDDYWTDENKLQKQVNALEQHEDCALCVHKVQVVDEEGKDAGYSIPGKSIDTGVITSESFIRLCTEYAFQTSSFLIRSNPWHQYQMNLPDFRIGAPVGDLPLLFYFGQYSNVYYIQDVMSCYRRGVQTSRTVQLAIADIDKKIEHARKMRIMFEKYDVFTNYKYHDVCTKRICSYYVTECLLSGSSKSILRNKEVFCNLNLSRKVYVIFASIVPGLGRKMYIKRLKSIRRKEKVI